METVFQEVSQEVDKIIQQSGEEVLKELQISSVHPELIKYLGKLKFRTSYGQNVLEHCLEVAKLAGSIAAELGLDINLAKRAGLFHDIGKAVEDDGLSHVTSGIVIAKQYQESAVVINAIASHHRNFPADNPYSFVVMAADTLSAARPGARGQQLEAYLARMESLEKLAKEFSEVEKIYAFQAGKEIWVIVNAKKVIKLLTATEKKEQELAERELKEQLLTEKIDITLEGKSLPLACLHPLTQLVQKIYDIFWRLGYQIVESPEIETEENNFTKLNMPPGHPARDMQDTFYLNNNLLLRTHTTNVQSRMLQANPNTELKIVSAGKVYRRDDDDASHTHQFTQVDCFAVGKDISFSHLKGTLELLVKELFGQQQIIRLRPSYFPFTEPSVEVDATCVQCQQK
ncbi:24935_t:CDS:2, partial [Entrophospora sp. SA101]